MAAKEMSAIQIVKQYFSVEGKPISNKEMIAAKRNRDDLEGWDELVAGAAAELGVTVKKK